MRSARCYATIAVLLFAVIGCKKEQPPAATSAENPVPSRTATTYQTAKLFRSVLTPALHCTGTIEPTDSIDIGAMVAGEILSFGNDVDGRTIDFRSQVTKGMVLAKIDPAPYQADLSVAEAALAEADAAVKIAAATQRQTELRYSDAKDGWEKTQDRFRDNSRATADPDYRKSKSEFDTCSANLDLAAAQLAQAKAKLKRAEADRDKAWSNVEYCTIRSPVDGVIIDRRVNVGQMSVSSLNVQGLFLIAKDLRHLMVWVSVNEAYIKKVHDGQNVAFTVDAFPNEQFLGVVKKIRLNAEMTQNVVMYTVEVNITSDVERLYPYMTADVKFELPRQTNVLLVSNAALRWRPAAEPNHARWAGHDTIWTSNGSAARPVKVRTGSTDGTNTEIIAFEEKGTELPVGTPIIVGE